MSSTHSGGESDTFTIGGASYSNGFVLKYADASGLEVDLCYRVSGKQRTVKVTFDWLAALFLLALAVVGLQYHLYWPWVLIVGLILRQNGILDSSWKRWHWVEHQIAFLLEQGVYPTRESMEQTSPINVRCGSVRVSMPLVYAVALCAMLDFGWWAWMVWLPAYALNFTYPPWRKPSAKRSGRIVHRILTIVAYPALTITLMMQRALYMRQPSKVQQDLALQWGQEASHDIARFHLIRAGHVHKLLSRPKP